MQLLLAIYNDGRAATSIVGEEAENHKYQRARAARTTL